jgi:hypothetical protein
LYHNIFSPQLTKQHRFPKLNVCNNSQKEGAKGEAWGIIFPLICLVHKKLKVPVIS